jgi:subtilisin family serine protease
VPTGHAFSSGWNVQLVRAPEVWRKTSGKDVRVGVFDTGIAPHMGYRDRLDPGASFVPGSPDTDDRKGVGHGTRCAGIIAARLPRWGLMGVAPDCRLVPIQILRSTGTTTAEWIIEAMHWASGQNLDVASLSFGGVNPLAPSINLAYERVIRLLIDQDCVLVAAAGNSGRSPSSFWVRRPASFKEVIAVGAVDARGELDERSSYTPVAGREEGVELVAPGMQVPTTKSEPTDTGLEYHSGTSAACPHVAGAAALLKQLEPGIKPAEARKVLIDSAADVHLDGHDVRTGFGLLDCAAAVSRL